MRTKKNEIGVTFPVKKWINTWKNRRTHLMSSYIQQTKQHGVEQKYPPKTFARAYYSTRYCLFSGVWNFYFGHQWLYSPTYHLLSKTQNNKHYYPCQFSGVKFSRRSHCDPAPRCLQSNLLLTHLCDFLHFFHPYINLHRAAHHGDDLWSFHLHQVGPAIRWHLSAWESLRRSLCYLVH